MSFRTTGPPRLGASTEKLEQCPYDPCHWIRPAKLDGHVVKCRLNHQENLSEKGQSLIWLNCQYNYLHKVVDKEWKFHCARCPDRKKIWSYQLRSDELKPLFPDMLTVSGGDISPEKAERVEMYAGLNEGLLWSNQLNGYKKLTDIGKNANQIAQDEAQEKGRALAKELENERKVASPTPPPSTTFEGRYTQEEIDYWNAPGTSKVPFSWLDYNSRPRGYVTNYPPGLTKKQRRAFDIKNSKEFEKKMAAQKKKEEEAARERGEEDQHNFEEEAVTASEEVEETPDQNAEEGTTQF